MTARVSGVPANRPVILFVDQFADVGGAQRTVLDLLSVIEQRYTPVVTLPGAGAFSAELERRGVRWMPLAIGRYRAGEKPAADLLRYALIQPVLAHQVAALAGLLRAALIYANGPRVFPATALASRRSGVPVLWHLQLELRSARDRRLVQAAARIARPAVVACSRACLGPFPTRSMIRRNAQVVYNGVPAVQRASAEAYGRRAGAGGPVIGVVGRLHPDKGQGDLLRAAPRILAAFPGARFRLVGPPADAAYERSLRQQAGALGGGRVEFAGAVSSPAEALAGLDLLVVPSRREAFGRVIPEAFSAGVPVLASDAGGIPEVIQPGSNGLLFPAGGAAVLAGAAVRILDDARLRESLVRNAKESYRRLWTLERFGREMLEVVTRQTARRRPGR